MYICDYKDRLEIENGEVVRILTATARKDFTKSLEIYKEYESGKKVCRNLYYSMYGYRVAFPNDVVSMYSNGTCSYIQDLEKYEECEIHAFKFYSYKLSENDKKNVISIYPDFKYVINKWNGTISQTLEVLRIWKEHKDIEFMLCAGFQNIALNKMII